MSTLPSLTESEPHMYLNMAAANWGSHKIDPEFGHIYRPNGDKGDYPRCAIDHFYKIAKDLKIGKMPAKPRPCKAEPGMEHGHPPPDRDLVSVSLFRWRCGLEVIHRNMGPSVAAVIIDLYSRWPEKLPVGVKRLSAYIVKWVRSRRNLKTKWRYHPRLLEWLDLCGNAQFEDTFKFYQDTALWPGDNRSKSVPRPRK